MNAFAGLLRRDLRLALRRGGDTALVVAFFVIVVVLFPLGVGPEPQMLSRMAPGVIWVAALLAVLLALERLFHADYEDGNLELMATAPVSLTALVLAKVVAHWLTTGLPLIVAAPVLAVLLQLDFDAFGVLVLSMLLGTPTLSLIGAVGAAITLGARRGGVLMTLLVLPLYVPVLIFAVLAVDSVLIDMTPRPHLLLLGGVLCAALPLAPWAAAAALRQAVE